MIQTKSTKWRTGRISLPPALLMFAAFLAASPNPPAASGALADAGAAPGSPSTSRPLSLDEARALARAADEQLAQMREAILGAEADVLAARADKLPQVNLGGTWTRNLKKPVFFLPPDLASGLGGATSVEMGGDWDLQAAATATLNLWTAGRLSAAEGMASQARASARWQEALVADAVVFKVETAYADVLLAQESVAIADGALSLAAETVRVTREGFDQGTASRFDLLRAQVEHTNRQTPLVRARNALDLATQNLLRICGLDPDQPVTLTDPLQEADRPAPLDELLTEMAGRSPELRALEHAVRASELGVDLARAGRGPVVQLQGRYAIQGQWDDELLPGDDEAARSASAALAVSVPIFDGFAARAAIQGREADLRAARLELERVVHDRQLGVRQARSNLENALASLEGRREGVDLAEEAYRLAVVRLENGLATPLERLDAEQALTEARLQLADSLYVCTVAAANLKLAVGGSAPGTGTHEEKPK